MCLCDAGQLRHLPGPRFPHPHSHRAGELAAEVAPGPTLWDSVWLLVAELIAGAPGRCRSAPERITSIRADRPRGQMGRGRTQLREQSNLLITALWGGVGRVGRGSVDGSGRGDPQSPGSPNPNAENPSGRAQARAQHGFLLTRSDCEQVASSRSLTLGCSKKSWTF